MNDRRPYDSPKRVLDAAAATAGLIVLSPVIAIVAALVAVKLGRPVLFKQDRPGLNGQVFRLYKFRSMTNVDPERGLVTDEQRLTSFGRTLRSTSLDELPTLINVVKGDMSIVGPRPLLVQYLARYSLEQARRHEVRPGITGLAQSSGRNSLSWEAKFALDRDYVEQRSIALDLRILAVTLLAVVNREGISAEGHATADEFMGTDSRGAEKL
ncbi:sugar transferase [Cryobacterium sp. Sr3]|uniref:sugar transferase n=1 Tax=Cryobacterium sp. Sr3 TaxID=1259194 RepID=UPI00106D833D|nr:sugar transferase [Cryobacterium sp. Sr3]TFB55270.1 sugar transferase [Cryobacterium sp. Sr3]